MNELLINWKNENHIKCLLQQQGILCGEPSDTALVREFMQEWESNSEARKTRQASEALLREFCGRKKRERQNQPMVNGRCNQISEQPSPIVPAQWNSAQVLQAGAPAYLSASAMAHKPAYLGIGNKQHEQTAWFLQQGSREQKSTPASIARTLIDHLVGFVTMGDALYAYNGRFYSLMTPITTQRLIMQHCQQEVNERGSSDIVREIYNLITISPQITYEGLCPDERYITFEDTILDLNTLHCVSHTPKIFDTSYIKVPFMAQENRDCPNFDCFVNQISGADPELTARIWEMIGYLISNDAKGKCFFVMQGVPNSGKSLLGKFITSLFCEEATTSMDVSSLGERFGLSALIGKKINSSLDLPNSIMNNVAVSYIKQLTGGDLMTADVKFINRVKFYNSCRLLFATNHAVRVSDQDDAFFDRLVVLPFYFSVSKEQQNPHLLQLFENEKSAIVRKAVLAYTQLRSRNYAFSGSFSVNEVTKSYRGYSSAADVWNWPELVRKFVEQCCIYTEPEQGCLTQELYRAFCDYVDSSELPYIGFSKHLQAFCKNKIKKQRWRADPKESNPQSGYRGIALRFPQTMV